MHHRGTTWKWDKQSRKNRWKNGVFYLVSMFPFRVTIFKLPEKVYFLEICANLSKKPKSIKSIYTNVSENSLNTLSMVYRGLSQCLWYISDQNIKKHADSADCKINFWIWKYSKFIFMWSPLWFILVCKIPQFLSKSYQFRQLITLF